MLITTLVAIASIAQAGAEQPRDPQPAQPTAPAQQAAPAPTSRGREVVCESRALTGQRLQRRICQTRDQWQAQATEKRKEGEEIVGRANIPSFPPGTL